MEDRLEGWLSGQPTLARIGARALDLVESFVPVRRDLGARLRNAIVESNRSLLNIAIVGAEGHGKSTLINGLLGRDLSPTEDDWPGTVAPIMFHWSNQAEPEFLVRKGGAARDP